MILKVSSIIVPLHLEISGILILPTKEFAKRKACFLSNVMNLSIVESISRALALISGMTFNAF